MICENCGSRIPDDSVFCEECGARIGANASTGAGYHAPAPPAAHAPVDARGTVSAPSAPPAAPAPPAAQQLGGYAPPPAPAPQQPRTYAPPPSPVPPQNGAHYRGQPGQQPHPKKKAPIGLILGIAAAVLVIGIGGFFGLRALIGAGVILPGTGTPPPASGSTASPAAPDEAAAQDQGPEGGEQPDTGEQPDAGGQPEETPAPAQGPQSDFAGYRGYVDGEVPSIGDFFWFTEDVRWDGPPPERVPITDFNEIAGYWKAYEETIPMSEGEGRYLMWLNIEISGSAEQVVVTYHTENAMALDEHSGNNVDLSSWSGSSYKGIFNGGWIAAGDMDKDGIEITINEFYTIDGKQYAIGVEHWASNEAAFIVLVRP